MRTAEPGHPSAIGRRVHVIGNSTSGKSTLAERLAKALQADFVELDALNWLPGWIGLNETDPEELHRRILHATRGDAWIVAGSYSALSQRAFWSRLETVIWLDLPLRVLLARFFRRSWRRWRRRELLWGTNIERFWPQFALWRGSDSLLYWILFHHHRKRRDMLGWMQDPRWSHIRFVRLTSAAEVETFARIVEAGAGPAVRVLPHETVP